LLYLGTCYEEYFAPSEFPEEDRDEYVVEIPQDAENVDPQIYDWVSDLLANYFNETTPRRVLVKGKNPVCTHGYAVTNRAARRLLLEMNDWLPFPVDITMIHYISEGRFKAYSVEPPLFVQWRNTQDPRKNSDIEGEGIELARNWGILRSARKNLVDWYDVPLYTALCSRWMLICKGYFWSSRASLVGWQGFENRVNWNMGHLYSVCKSILDRNLGFRESSEK